MKVRTKDDPRRESKSAKWCYHSKKVLMSYANKTDPKILLALTTMYDAMRKSKDNEGETETLGVLRSYKRRSQRFRHRFNWCVYNKKPKQWLLKASFFLCNTVKSNAETL